MKLTVLDLISAVMVVWYTRHSMQVMVMMVMFTCGRLGISSWDRVILSGRVKMNSQMMMMIARSHVTTTSRMVRTHVMYRAGYHHCMNTVQPLIFHSTLYWRFVEAYLYLMHIWVRKTSAPYFLGLRKTPHKTLRSKDCYMLFLAVTSTELCTLYCNSGCTSVVFVDLLSDNLNVMYIFWGTVESCYWLQFVLNKLFILQTIRRSRDNRQPDSW